MKDDAPSAAIMEAFDIPGIMGLGVQISDLSRLKHHCTLCATTP
jgi:hypothetical protein